MIYIQPPEGLKLNLFYELIKELLKKSSIPVTPSNPNTRKLYQIKSIASVF